MEKTNVTWLRPLFHHVTVGVDDTGQWYMENGPISGFGHLSLLPLMEPGYGGNYHSAVSLLVSRLSEVGLPTAFVDSFPFDAPVRLALLMGGRWGGLACEWLPFVEIDDELAELLRNALDNLGGGRRARQKTRRALEEWERQQFIERLARRKTGKRRDPGFPG